jgi:allantoin racemase
LASVRHIALSARDSYPERTSPEELVKRVLEVSRKFVEEDGAEAILMGCTLQSCPLTVGGTNESLGAPIIDPVLVGMKVAEFMIEVRLAGLPTLSRLGTWQKPPAGELKQLLKH